MSTSITIRNWIKNRKSTFINGLQDGGRINDTVIEEILENATWAPTHGLGQVWEFKVFADAGVDAFFREQQSIYKATTLPEKFNETKYQKFTEKSNRVSHIIAVIARRDPKKRFPKQEDIVSVACAVQNIYLSLQAYGIGGYLSTGNICYAEEMRIFLGLEEEDECLGFFTLGIPDSNLKRPQRKRIPASEKTEWIRV
jgi:nitroreductase